MGGGYLYVLATFVPNLLQNEKNHLACTVAANAVFGMSPKGEYEISDTSGGYLASGDKAQRRLAAL